MGFLDKAKEAAQQAQKKLEEQCSPTSTSVRPSRPVRPQGGVPSAPAGATPPPPAAATPPPAAAPADGAPAAPETTEQPPPPVPEGVNTNPDPFKPIE